MEVTGTIKKIGLVLTITETFKTRTLVLETEDKYPQLIELQAVNQGTSFLDTYIEGDRVKIEFNLRGREWKSNSGDLRYFNTLQIWKIEFAEKLENLKNKNNFVSNNNPEKRHWSGLSGDIATSSLDENLERDYSPDENEH